jgi:twitching motility two-component system response regulator PilH
MSYFDSLFSIFRKRAPSPPAVDSGSEVQPAQSAKPQVERRNDERRNAIEGTRALIIDDSKTVVFALKKILISTGYTTLEALDAESGIELARAEEPDVIFLDIVLPGMNGFAALRALRRDPQTKDIPIIMMSGNEQATEQFYGDRIGADDFIKKPFTREEVFSDSTSWSAQIHSYAALNLKSHPMSKRFDLNRALKTPYFLPAHHALTATPPRGN